MTPGTRVDPKLLLSRLSYSQFAELMTIEEQEERAFYEIECVRAAWSVRELKRQIGSLYFQRSALSRDPHRLAGLLQADAAALDPKLSFRDPYVFEFLGLRSPEVMGESDLEDALLDRLQTFMLELGHGFCFEARQKRIQIGATICFIDLVFYHRILKCHVLIELKVADFSHEHLGQLNTYVSWYKRNMTTDGDSPPIGLLLCKRKDNALVHYALADLPNTLFVSKYQVELPTLDQLRDFLNAPAADQRPRDCRQVEPVELGKEAENIPS
jgi:predicted nuclease of restriction endonuclease-like (RecB) superfamily